ncbi:MAG: hypothetical protein HC905_16465, partial [Bacteroidales bacterium]|nr:hypothetical protein [Bacteroidales bacterium]
FVYTKSGSKQVVMLGAMNETDVVIEKGLDENDVIYLAIPEKPESFGMKGKELIAEIKAKSAKKKKDDLKVSQASPKR